MLCCQGTLVFMPHKLPTMLGIVMMIYIDVSTFMIRFRLLDTTDDTVALY